jgi:hypothetical protein
VLKGSSSFNYQAKGRIFEAAYLNSICISEYFPRHESLLSQNAMPIFTNDEEMIEIIKKVLQDDDYFKSVKAAMQSEIANRYTLEKISILLQSFIVSDPSQKTITSQLPFTLLTATIVNKASYLKNPWICIECGMAKGILSDSSLMNRLMITIFSITVLAVNTLVYCFRHSFGLSNAN